MMKYFREYNWWAQLGLLALMMATLASFGGVIMVTILKFTPYTLTSITTITENSPASLINTALLVQGIGSLFIFLVPALLFAYLAHPQPRQYLGLRPPGRNIHLLLVVLLMLGAIPLLEALDGLISKIDFGPKVKAAQAANDHMFKAFLSTPDFVSFCRTFLVLAICPALGEELFFRGLLMRFVQKRVRGRAFPMFFTSVIFAYMHSNVYGFLSIFMAGMLLAYIYYTTGSIWCGILGHLVFNGSQVLLIYLGSTNATVKHFMDGDSVPLVMIAGGAILFGVSFYLLQKNRTPLPENWDDDFPPVKPTDDPLDFAAST